MSDYTQSTFFAPKDLLATGNPNKIIYGSDVDAELSAISTAIATKADVNGDAIGAGTPCTELSVDNLKLDGNKIISTDTDGDIELEPDGTGIVTISSDVGIGTTSPNSYASNKLHLNGASTSIALRLTNTTTGTTVNDGSDIEVSGSDLNIINRESANTVFFTGNAERMRVDASGNVGLGVTPSAWSAYKAFQMQAGSLISFSTNDWRMVQNVVRTGATLDYLNNGPAHMYLQDGVGGGHQWFSAPSGTAGNTISFTQAMTLDSSGNLGIGTASPSAKLEVEDDDFARLDLNLSDASGTTIADVRGLVAGSEKWRLGKTASSSDDFTINVAGSEALRVDTGGDLLVGKASGSTTEEGHKIFGSGQYYMYSTATQVQRYYETSTGNQVGSIAITTTATTYNTSSDARLKENIAGAEDAGAKVDAIKVRQFDWKSDGSHQDYGMVAQELMTVAPEAVSGDPESDNMMGVDYSKLVPMLVKEIQSLRARVAALEA